MRRQTLNIQCYGYYVYMGQLYFYEQCSVQVETKRSSTTRWVYVSLGVAFLISFAKTKTIARNVLLMKPYR